jgi:hypothetical protein
MTMTHDQLDLFGDPVPEPRTMMLCPHCHGHGVIPVEEATSRSNDPATSQEAGDRQAGDPRRFRKGSRQSSVLAHLSLEPLTAQEVAIRVVGLNAPISALEGTRRRVSSLKRIGFIEDSGQERTNPGSPTPSAVYRITPTGQEALDRLRETGWSV